MLNEKSIEDVKESMARVVHQNSIEKQRMHKIKKHLKMDKKYSNFSQSKVDCINTHYQSYFSGKNGDQLTDSNRKTSFSSRNLKGHYIKSNSPIQQERAIFSPIRSMRSSVITPSTPRQYPKLCEGTIIRA